MSNVEIFKRATEAVNRLDVDAYVSFCTADIEWYPVLGGTVEGGSFRGREGIERYFGELRETWEEFRVVFDEFRDLDNGVLAFGRLEGRGRGGGVQVELSVGAVTDFRDGKVWRLRVFSDYGEALEAAGLVE
jgi:ketosteroid isomerase-like protein